MEQLERDVERAKFMNSLGFETLRFWNHDVLLRTHDVLEKIYARLDDIDRHMTARKKKLYGWGKV